MVIKQSTKINELLSAYPFIKDYLIALNPHYKALDSPLMRKTIGRVATINRAAFIGGIDVEELMKGITEEIKRKTGETIEVRSEKISDAESRIEVLKGVIKDLHRGVDVSIAKQRFHELIKDVTPSEIAQMEQKLIAEGMPEEEVKRLCDVHVEVFKESLEKGVIPGLSAGHPVYTFMLENRVAEKIIHNLEEIQDLVSEREKLKSLLEDLGRIDAHYLRKENQLFPILEAKGMSGPSKVMWALHDDIRKLLKDVTAKASISSVDRGEFRQLLQMMKDMIYKEEHILFPMALETLDEAEWARVKRGEHEIGYAWLEAVEEWKPAEGAYQQALPPEKVGSLNLDTGQLTIEQVNLILTHLPVDISFVNERDEVVYYSQTKERIFPRSPGIIGRKVQNCHPPKSVALVDKILDGFNSGERDSAEFWIQMKGNFIHIRYFAVRDAQGKYKGTLEVSQDVTEIRNLQGQKRLLDWD